MSSHSGIVVLEHNPILEFWIWRDIDFPSEVEEAIKLRPFCGPAGFGASLLEFLHHFDYGLILVAISDCLLDIPEDILLFSNSH